MKKNMCKCLLSLCLTVLLLLTSLFTLPACSPNPPDVELVYDRLVELIEKSHEVNVVMFGCGLPVYARGSDEDKLIHRYYGVVEDGREFVSEYAKFENIDDIKTAARQVYSEDYCNSIFESLFTGYASEGISGSILPARYSEDEKWVYQNSHVDPLVTGTRVYDYASMKIVSPSSSNMIKVEINSYAEDHPEEWVTVDLSFVYENGNWYLDGPSC